MRWQNPGPEPVDVVEQLLDLIDTQEALLEEQQETLNRLVPLLPKPMVQEGDA